MSNNSNSFAEISGEVLSWVRSESGYSIEQVSKELQIPKERLITLEQGVNKLSYEECSTFSSLYKRAIATLLLPKVPKKRSQVIEKRIFNTKKELKFTPSIWENIHDAISLREKYLELVEYKINSQIPKVPVSKYKDLVSIVENLLSLKKRYSQPNTQYLYLRKKIEQLGILVFQYDLSLLDIHQNCRGLSIMQDKYIKTRLPIILINKGDTDNGKIFTILHELVHVIIAENDWNLVDVWGEKKTERYCDIITANFLMPEQEILLFWNKYQNSTSQEERDTVQILSKHFCVSKYAILVRLYKMKLIDLSLYKSLLGELNIKSDHWDGESEKENKFYAKYATRCLGEKGFLFVSAVIEKISTRKIDIQDASSLLNLRKKHFGDLLNSVKYRNSL